MITNKAPHRMTMEEKVNKLVTDVALLNQKLDLLMKNLRCAAHEERFGDHEERIRALEQNKTDDHEERLKSLETFKNKSEGEKKIYGIISSAVVAVVVGIIVGVIVRLF